jgi:hypothetical protein
VRSFAILASLLASTLLFAGCLDSSEPDEDSDDDSTTVDYASDAPPGCDATRRAVAHGANGAAASWTGALGIPCLVTTVWGTGEPSIGLTSDGSLFLYPSFQAPAEAVDAAGQFTGLGMARSMDEGESFERKFSEVAGTANFHPYSADPFMYVDPYTDRVFMEDLAIPPFNCANLSYSDDNGDTWTQTLGGCLVWDHVGYGSGPSTLNDLNGYPVVIQRCAITYVATTVASEASGCQKSLDGGATWQPPGDPAFLFDQDGVPYAPSTCNGAVHHVFVDHRGWTWLGRNWCDQKPYLALSKDEGATWTRSKISDGLAAGHDVGVGVDPAGNVYTFWTSAELRPLIAVSKDDGATWSEPMDISVPGLETSGAISIASGGVGKAAFLYAATIDSDPGNVHAVIANAYGLDGDSPVFLSAVLTTPDDPLQAGTCAGGFCDGQADFLDGSIGPDGTAWGSFVHGGKLAGGRLWGAPSLWDASDPNGVYGGWGEGSTTP